jgi:hypothetical protein
VKARKKIIIVLIFALLVLSGYLTRETKLESVKTIAAASESFSYQANLKRDVLCLLLAYPDYIRGLTKNEEGKVYVVLKSGKKIIYDDFKKKNAWQKSDNPDIQDMLEQIYPLTELKELLPEYYNPGCARIYPCSKKFTEPIKARFRKTWCESQYRL